MKNLNIEWRQIFWKTRTRKIVSTLLLVLTILFLYQHHAGPNKEVLSNNLHIVLSSDDLAVAKKEDFLLQVPISGELYPLDQTTVIAKVSAEAENVFVREGEAVKKNQWLAKLNKADLIQILEEKKAALSSAEASYKLSVITTARYKKLLEQHFYSQNDYDAALNQIQVNAANVKQAKAALNEAELQLKYTDIISSLDGIVSQRNIDAGMNVSIGQTLFKIVNLSNLELRAVVPANQVSLIKPNQVVIFEVDGITHSFTGKVVRINPSTVSGTRAYYAYVDVENSSQILKNGMFATGEIILDKQPNSITIPYEAVRHEVSQGIRNDYVYIVDSQKQLQKRVIKLGLVDAANNKVQVISGVNAGDLLIVSGIEVQKGNSVILPLSYSSFFKTTGKS